MILGAENTGERRGVSREESRTEARHRERKAHKAHGDGFYSPTEKPIHLLRVSL